MWRNARISELKRRRELDQELRDGVVLEEGESTIGEDESQCPSVNSLMKQSYVTPLEVRDHMTRLWSNQKALVNAIIGCCAIAESACEVGGGVPTEEISPADVFFLEVIPVPPSRFRPVSTLLLRS